MSELTPDAATDERAASTGIGGLKLKRPAGDRAPAAPDPTSGGDATEGDKGGDGGQPPSPPSNATFLESAIRDVAEGAAAAVCSKAGDPADGSWIAFAAADVDRQCPDDLNNYLNCSSFVLDADGELLARKDGFSAYHILVLDDVGTKVDRSKLAGFVPTWDIETSPGNSQVGIRLTQPIRDPAEVARLQNAVKAAGLSDPGAAGLARWVRLPNAINGKAKYRADGGEPFRCRLLEWNPDVSYTVEGLADALGLTLDTVSTAGAVRATNRSASAPAGNEVFTPTPRENPVLAALRTRGLVKRTISAGKHDVTCPWTHEHTDGIDGRAAYFEPDEAHPTGGFRCLHSHGDHLHIGDLLKFLGLQSDQARGKARIDIVPGEMNRVRRAAEQTLALRGGYFQMGGAIVVIRSDASTGDVTTDLLGEPALASALSEAADWYRYDGRANKAVRADPPPRNVMALLKSERFDYLPALTGLARQPYFREDGGELVLTPGYDARSGRYGAFDASQFVLPEPTMEAAREALTVLQELLAEFRFATEADRSAAICAMLTAAVRPSLPVAPAFNITASSPGSGKSYLAGVISPFAGPGGAMKVSYPTSADEATKTMLSTFLSSPAVVVFDDMQTQWVPFGAINRALTSDTITDRVLGLSRMVTAGTRSFIMGTGNNVGPIRDMTRRVVTITLHHRTSTPALVRYEGRPEQVVKANRGRYVAAALTIIAAWKAAGSPNADVPSIASYGVWSDMCREPLIWLGLPDPAASIIEQLHHDPDQDSLGTLLREWFAFVGDEPVMLRDVLARSEDHADLEDALLELPVVERGTINRSKLGWYLKRNAGRVVGGLELQAASNSTRNAWRVVAVDVNETAVG